MDVRNLFDEHLQVCRDARETLPAVLDDVVRNAWRSIAEGGRILVCGNGGSAADAQHFAAECVVRYERAREATLPAIALTTDTSALTATANDVGFEYVFARQVRAFARPGDILFAISTSGRSPNVLRAVEEARRARCHVVGFTGLGGNELASMADIVVAVPSSRVARIQEVHILCLHAIASELESKLTETPNAHRD
jgi:D-sedoheptulose 7-phosphate isomerase